MTQRDIGPKVKDTRKPKGYSLEELDEIERQLDTMQLKLADAASGAHQVKLTVLGKPTTVYAIRWDATTRERVKTNEVYFHFDERLGRLELHEAQPHGETLWMKKVHKPGELRRAHYAAENFIRTQGLRVVEQRKTPSKSESLLTTSELRKKGTGQLVLERVKQHLAKSETVTSADVPAATPNVIATGTSVSATRRKGSFFNSKGTYKCVECGKMTRDTNTGEGPLQLCKSCYEKMELENQRADHDVDQQSVESVIVDELHRAKESHVRR